MTAIASGSLNPTIVKTSPFPSVDLRRTGEVEKIGILMKLVEYSTRPVFDI